MTRFSLPAARAKLAQPGRSTVSLPVVLALIALLPNCVLANEKQPRRQRGTPAQCASEETQPDAPARNPAGRASEEPSPTRKRGNRHDRSRGQQLHHAHRQGSGTCHPDRSLNAKVATPARRASEETQPDAQARKPSPTRRAWKKVREFSAPEAIQAAAADKRFVYAIASRQIAKYDRVTMKRVAISQGKARHLNSGFLWQGRLLCAHSNYPQKPELSEIKSLDPKTMRLTTFKSFGDYGGSLTWVIRKGGHWWCNFARYEKDNGQTFLAKFDDNWQEQGRWLFPKSVVKQLGRFSLSGGLWYKNELLATGHDNQEVYRLRLPKQGKVLRYLGKESIPFTGQGFAIDLKTDGLVGISRARRKVIFVTPVSSK